VIQGRKSNPRWTLLDYKKKTTIPYPKYFPSLTYSWNPNLFSVLAKWALTKLP
jgi:hypothetical protein